MGGPALGWLAALLLALGIGPLWAWEVNGEPVVLSAIDVAAIGVLGHGLVVARRRGSVRLDPAVAPLALLLLVLAVQLATTGAPVSVLGGISRFVASAAVVVGLSQLTVAPVGQLVLPRTRANAVVPAFASPDSPWAGPVPWARVVTLLTAALAVPVLADWVRAWRDPGATSFYALKNAVVLPLGASNYLAAFLVVGLLVGLAVVRVDRWLVLPCVVAGLGLLATMSRGALLAVGTVVVGRAVGRRLGPRLGLLVGIAIALAAVGGLVVANLDDGIGAGVPGLRTPTDDRFALLRVAWHATLEHPLLGVGINRFATVTGELAGRHDHAHNLFLHAAATTGLVGLVAQLGVWLALARRLVLAAPGPGRSAVRSAAVGLFVHAQVEALSSTRAVEVVVALLLVVGSTLPRSDRAAVAATPVAREPSRRADVDAATAALPA